MNIWFPHVTVATIVQKNSKFLLVLEESDGKKVYNQPAGHLEENESLLDAAIRETVEETAWRVKLQGYLGVSQYFAPSNSVTYIRHTFVAEPLYFDENVKRDADIIDTAWLTYDEILQCRGQHRSPLVMHDINRFVQNKALSLDVVSYF
ncbi:MAG: 8-oxo-dGTP pyrophosphatase MutT (NUDIX family) [Lentisphaeria bacterium]|jgi:8-oxo-dGTP pyrophosphatase MutT (NUDIX family)